MMDSEAAPHGGRAYRAWLLVLFVAIYASSSLDRLMLATLGPALRADLGISDLQFGLLSGLFFAILYTVGGLPIARFADRHRRIPILAAATALWSAMTLLSGFAANFVQLVLCRIGLGLGESGCSPTAYSILSDQYPRGRRAGAIAILGLGVPLGSALGALLGGWSSEHGGWRQAFLIAGVPGLVLAVLALATLREPPRGAFDAPVARADAVPGLGAVLKLMWSKPACRHLILLAVLCLFCNNGLNLFLPSFFVRVHGLSPFVAGKYFSLLIGVAAGVGTTGLGLLVSRLGANDPRRYCWSLAAIMLAGTPLYLFAFVTPSFGAAYASLFVATCIGFAFLGPVVAAINNMVAPQMRASASAVLQIAMQLIGSSAGSAFTGWTSDRIARSTFQGDYGSACRAAGAGPAAAHDPVAAACHTAAAVGLRWALAICALVFLWAAVHALLAARTIRRDLALPAAETPGEAEDAVEGAVRQA